MDEGGFDTEVKIEDLPGEGDVQKLREYVGRYRQENGRGVHINSLRLGFNRAIARSIELEGSGGNNETVRKLFYTEQGIGVSTDTLNRRFVGFNWPLTENGQLFAAVITEEPRLLGGEAKRMEKVVKPATLGDVQEALGKLQRALENSKG